MLLPAAVMLVTSVMPAVRNPVFEIFPVLIIFLTFKSPVAVIPPPAIIFDATVTRLDETSWVVNVPPMSTFDSNVAGATTLHDRLLKTLNDIYIKHIFLIHK
jgi:hypothetical protein